MSNNIPDFTFHKSIEDYSSTKRRKKNVETDDENDDETFQNKQEISQRFYLFDNQNPKNEFSNIESFLLECENYKDTTAYIQHRSRENYATGKNGIDDWIPSFTFSVTGVQYLSSLPKPVCYIQNLDFFPKNEFVAQDKNDQDSFKLLEGGKNYSVKDDIICRGNEKKSQSNPNYRVGSNRKLAMCNKLLIGFLLLMKTKFEKIVFYDDEPVFSHVIANFIFQADYLLFQDELKDFINLRQIDKRNINYFRNYFKTSKLYNNLANYLLFVSRRVTFPVWNTVMWISLNELEKNPKNYLDPMPNQQTINSSGPYFKWFRNLLKGNDGDSYDFNTVDASDLYEILSEKNFDVSDKKTLFWWDNLRFSMDHIYFHIIQKFGTSYVLTKLTKFTGFDVGNGEEEEQDYEYYKTTQNDLVIDYLERVNIDPKNPEPLNVGSEFIKSLYSITSKLGVQLWVKSIVETPTAAGFWEKMKSSGYVKLSKNAHETIRTQKKNLVDLFIRGYFQRLLEKTLMRDLKKMGKDDMNKLLESELKSVRRVDDKFVGDNMSMSVELPDDDTQENVIVHENKFKF